MKMKKNTKTMGSNRDRLAPMIFQGRYMITKPDVSFSSTEKTVRTYSGSGYHPVHFLKIE